MGQNSFCDLCRKDVPTQDALTPVKIGDADVADACLNCASALKTGLEQKKTAANTALLEAQAKANLTAPAPAPGQPAAPEQPAPQEQTPPANGDTPNANA